MLRGVVKALVGMLGFVIGFAVVVGLEVGLLALIEELFRIRMRPRGIGWVILPIAGGILAGILALEVYKSPTAVRDRLSGKLLASVQPGLPSSIYRYAISGAIVWWMVLAVLVWGVELFGSYWGRDDWRKFWVLFVGPPLIGVTALLLVRWSKGTQE